MSRVLEILAWGQDARGKDVLGLEIVPSDACDWHSGSRVTIVGLWAQICGLFSEEASFPRDRKKLSLRFEASQRGFGAGPGRPVAHGGAEGSDGTDVSGGTAAQRDAEVQSGTEARRDAEDPGGTRAQRDAEVQSDAGV